MNSTSARTEQVLSTLRLHRGDWQERFHVVDIGVFGSVARGDARPDSDVDVWVRLDPLTPYALVHLKQELETLLSTSVDVVRLRERMNPSLKQRILDEGLRP
ncbi:nucleotidyltransferase family protein [Synechococcus sp. BA-132 BA5]|uniref:nucleotidyltransferase family protein n=1 Tax=Synechococcus sp. BA-132 BA5 TaxID=3110252 RepID=UPI002B218148|nr:nucleotidyltransferase domain-containing protein [Synechococcus sp. BA-132 BA5]MEA5414546.1 nucleotidyltransferase domain-containing protein [Synechococcus sp. BA-132 BA5]